MKMRTEAGIYSGFAAGSMAAAGLFLLLLLLIKPNRKRDVSGFKGKMYAHRGLHDDKIPENSMAAFLAAKEHGYGVELDVQMTKDDQLVVFHDGSLWRMCGVRGKLKDYTYKELQRFSLKDTEEKIPLFSDVLKLLDKTDIICELKNNNGNFNYYFCERVCEEIKNYKGNICIESFSPFLLRWFYKNRPEIIRGQLSNHMAHGDGMHFPANLFMTHLLVNRVSRPDFISYRFSDIRTFGYRLCRKLYAPFCVVWTVKGQKQIRDAKKNFDTIIFEKSSANR
ncbi:MAG TPA: glycerophosphodiester phosphodiesterase family protein [Lachnospiraceae bacterium]|nr:glycerophosphodiester phosphodiesterase family protein [Lachnospiraceae bacterium]